MAVAADDRHPRLGKALLRADDVHDALVDVAHWVVGDAECFGVRPKGVDLLGRDLVGDRLVDALGGDVVVLGGDGEVRTAYRPPVLAEAIKGLRRGHLMDEVEVNIEKVGLPVFAVDDVFVPHLLAQGSRLLSHSIAGYR